MLGSGRWIPEYQLCSLYLSHDSTQVRTTAWYYNHTQLYYIRIQARVRVQIYYSTFIAAETVTHPWVFYLDRRLADPATRRQLTRHTLRTNQRRGLQNRKQETGSQGACHHHSLYIKILATRVSTKFVLARLWVYSKILWYMHGRSRKANRFTSTRLHFIWV